MGLEAEPLRLERQRPASGEGVVEGGEALRVEQLPGPRVVRVVGAGPPPALPDLGPRRLQDRLVGGVCFNPGRMTRRPPGIPRPATGGGTVPATGSRSSDDVGADARFETVAEEVFRRYRRHWKPSTLAVNRAYLRNQILPWFKGRPIAAITRAEVRRWLATLHRTPAAANRSLPILSVILRQAELYGLRPPNSNPCRRCRLYPQRGRERFLSHEETRRLGATLAAQSETAPLLSALVRLSLLTGCRPSEIRTLPWAQYREGRLFLADSKTGPRTVWLSRAARRVLDGLPRTGPWVFPASAGPGAISAEALYRFWCVARVAAGVPDLRLHDLRHSYASFALRQGETILVIGRLLGHRDPASTLRYTHLDDAMVRQAVEVVGAALAG